MNGYGVHPKKSKGYVKTAFIKQMAAAYEAHGHSFDKDLFPKSDLVLEQSDASIGDKISQMGLKTGGIAFLAQCARFANPMAAGDIYRSLLDAPTIRRGMKVYAAAQSAVEDIAKITITDVKMSNGTTRHVVRFDYHHLSREFATVASVICGALIMAYIEQLHANRPPQSMVTIRLYGIDDPNHILQWEFPCVLECLPGKRGVCEICIDNEYASRPNLCYQPERWAAARPPLEAIGLGVVVKDRIYQWVQSWDYSISKPTVETVADALYLTVDSLNKQCVKAGIKAGETIKRAECERLYNARRSGLTMDDCVEYFGWSSKQMMDKMYIKHRGYSLKAVERLSPLFV